MVTMLLKKTYYGFKLHAMVTFDSFITNITVIPAHIDNHEAL